MKAIVCEMCGSQDLVKKDGMYICQNCGTKYDPEEAKKLMVEVSGTVAVDNSNRIQNYYRLARRAKEDGNVENAEKYYGLILEEEPNNWEANFYQVYYQCRQAKISDMDSACYKLADALRNSFQLVSIADITEEEKRKAYQEIYSMCDDYCLQIQYNTIAASSKISDWGTRENFEQKNYKAVTVLQTALGDECFNYGLESQALEIYKKALDFKFTKLTDSEVNSLVTRAKRIDPEFVYEAQKVKSGGGCYVATAVYGSYDCPQVWTLRRYRDYTLAETWFGRAFIRTYYAVSPTLVKWFGQAEWFKKMWKPTLDRMVKDLNEKGLTDTPYQDREW